MCAFECSSSVCSNLPNGDYCEKWRKKSIQNAEWQRELVALKGAERFKNKIKVILCVAGTLPTSTGVVFFVCGQSYSSSSPSTTENVFKKNCRAKKKWNKTADGAKEKKRHQNGSAAKLRKFFGLFNCSLKTCWPQCCAIFILILFIHPFPISPQSDI